jgi:hypothetical protein
MDEHKGELLHALLLDLSGKAFPQKAVL